MGETVFVDTNPVQAAFSLGGREGWGRQCLLTPTLYRQLLVWEGGRDGGDSVC